jgi:hypothetical protein
MVKKDVEEIGFEIEELGDNLDDFGYDATEIMLLALAVIGCLDIMVIYF